MPLRGDGPTAGMPPRGEGPTAGMPPSGRRAYGRNAPFGATGLRPECPFGATGLRPNAHPPTARLEGQRPDLSPAQGNARGCVFTDGEALPGRPNLSPGGGSAYGALPWAGARDAPLGRPEPLAGRIPGGLVGHRGELPGGRASVFNRQRNEGDAKGDAKVSGTNGAQLSAFTEEVPGAYRPKSGLTWCYPAQGVYLVLSVPLSLVSFPTGKWALPFADLLVQGRG